MDQWIRNFIWSGDVVTKKICTVAWSKVCKPYDKGGLNVRSLNHINDSLLLHLCWRFFSSNDQWAVMCRARCLKWGLPSNAFLKSSIGMALSSMLRSLKKTLGGFLALVIM
jgi:hypothetical protein